MNKPKHLIPNQNNNRNQMSAIVSQSTIHSGPLPDAETLEKYNNVVPGAAERILIMAEKEQDARHELNKIGIDNILKIEEGRKSLLKRGQIFALVIAIVIILFASYLAYLNATSAAAWVVGAVLVGSILAFVSGKNKREDSNKKEVVK